jgi:tetratricopeptide (TPR) repeat protein
MLADLNWIVRSGPPPRRPADLPSQEEVVAAFRAAVEAGDLLETGRRYRQFGVDDTQEYLIFAGQSWVMLGMVNIGVRLLRAAAIKPTPDGLLSLLAALDLSGDPERSAIAKRILDDSAHQAIWWYAAFALNRAASSGQITMTELFTELEAKQQTSAGVKLVLGLVLHERGQYERARTSIRHALRQLKADEPGLASLMSMGHAILARSELAQRKPKDALKNITKAEKLLQIDPPSRIELRLEQLKLQIIALAQLGEVGEAQSVIIKAMALLLEVNAPEEYQALFTINAQLAASARDHSVADIKLPDPIPLPARLPLRPSLHLPTRAA